MRDILNLLNNMSEEEFLNLVKSCCPGRDLPTEAYDLHNIQAHSSCVNEREC